MQAHPDALKGFPDTIGVAIIVPENEAFDKIHDWDSRNETTVVDILRYHISPGTVSVGTTEAGTPIFARTLLDGSRVIERQHGDEVVFTSGADTRSMVLEGDIEFSDGLIHVVDTVMVPPPGLVPLCRVYNPALGAFLGALYQANLSEQIIASKNVTVNGTSWATLGGKNVTVTVAGNNRYIASSQILDPDILIGFGVIHMLGDVLNPVEANTRPVPPMVAQPPAFALIGSTSTGNRFPVPFTSALPCTADCPRPTHAKTIRPAPLSSPVDNGVAGGPGPKCTGLMGAMGVGVGVGALGVGWLGAAGAL